MAKEQLLTKADLTAALETHGAVITESIRGLNLSLTHQIAGVATNVTTLKKDVADLKEEMTLVQAALTEYLQTDRSLHVLVEQLMAQGLKLDAAAIFPLPQ